MVLDADAMPDAPPSAAVAAIQKDEADARAKAAAEMVVLAHFCSSNAGYDDAREVYEKAIALNPNDAGLKAEVEKLKNRKGAPWKDAAAKIADKRAKCLAKCTELLGPVILAYAQADRGDDLSRLVSLLREVGAPVTGLDIAWFEPYLDWHSKKDAENLQAGWELVDGAWLAPDKVAELDHAHFDWLSPWVVSDDAFEVRTTQPLRIARQVLVRAESVRSALLRYFSGEWDLKPPAAKLRIFVMGTRADFDARMHVECPDAVTAPRDSPAYYADAPAAGNACFVAFEVLDLKDHIVKLDFNGLRWSMEHEIAHQVAFEYSKHVTGRGRLVHAALWAIEGFAEFVPYLRIENGAVVVTHPSYVPSGGREIDSAFSWCRQNVDKIPPIDEFIGMPRQKFVKGAAENWRIAATLGWYLLEGNGRSRRAGFVKYLETIHQDRDESDSLAACIKGLNLATIDAEFRAFCRSLRVDEK